jgi:VanZ family protein
MDPVTAREKSTVEPSAARLLRGAFTVVAILIVYGSLFPFRFAEPANMAALLSHWRDSTSTGDILGNILLFLPYGFLGPFALEGAARKTMTATAVSGLLLAVLCQVAQLFLPTRDPSGVDVVWNAAGLFIGMGAAALPGMAQRVPHYAARPVLSLPLLLLGLWGASQLVPFVPSLDLAAFRQSLKPLLTGARFEAANVPFLTFCWLAAACAAAEALRRQWRDIYLPLGIAAVLCLKVLIVDQIVTWTDALAAIAAVSLWLPLAPWWRRRPAVLASLLLAAYALSGLAPFDFGRAKPFLFLPFGGFLMGSMLGNAQSFCLKLFTLGVLFWLFGKGGKARAALWPVTGVIALVELAQVWLPGRTAEITDILLSLAIGFGMAALPQAPREETPPPVALGAAPRSILLLVAGCCAVMMGLGLILHMPGVPYNIAELFGGRGRFSDLLLFGMAVMALGAGPALAARFAARHRAPALTLPLGVFLSGIFIYFCLSSAVTPESMHDIIGSTEIAKRIAAEGLWGGIGQGLLGLFGAPTLAVLEPMLRFIALIAPLILFFGLFLFLSGGRQERATLVALAVAVLLCLGLSRYVVIALASTDNLTELIAPRFLGLPGWLYLYALAALIAGAAAILALGQPRALAWIIALLAPLPGWVLFNAGLNQAVEKYGLRFPAPEFLLGPDRLAGLSETALFLRWTMLQLAATGILAFGAVVLLRRRGKSRKDSAKRTKKVGRASMYPFLVNFTVAQARFLEQLAKHLDVSLSEAVSSVLSEMMPHLGDAEESGRPDFIENLKKQPREMGATYRQVSILLPDSQMAFVGALAHQAHASHSGVVRHLVAEFIDLCEDDGEAETEQKAQDTPL